VESSPSSSSPSLATKAGNFLIGDAFISDLISGFLNGLFILRAGDLTKAGEPKKIATK